MIIAIIGCPGVGKTTTCNALKMQGFKVRSIDDFFEKGKSKYNPQNSKQAYTKLFKSLEKGDYLLDVCGNAPEFLAHKEQVCDKIIKLHAPYKTIVARYKQRQKEEDISLQEFKESEEVESDVVIDTSRLDVQQVAKIVLEHLKQE